MTGRSVDWVVALLVHIGVLGCADTESRSVPPWPLPSSTAGLGGGLNAAGQGNVPKPSAPTMPANWAMVGFEDPVAISFSRHIGCFLGLPAGDNLADACGELRVIASAYPRFIFAISFGQDAPNVIYAADVYVAADGSRMAGTFATFERRGDQPVPDPQGWQLGFAWLPLDDIQPMSTDKGLVSFPPHSQNDLPVPERFSGLKLVTDEAGQRELAPDHVYRWSFGDTGRGIAIQGELGAFFDTEIRWDEAAQTLSAGPVVATRPGYPVALEIHYAAGKVTDAIATTAGGARYLLERADLP